MMGMYDELRCYYPLPGMVDQDGVFQTKSLARQFDCYEITAAGELIRYINLVGLDDQGWVATPNTNAKETEAVAIDGKVIFYNKFTYRAVFEEGKIVSLERIKESERSRQQAADNIHNHAKRSGFLEVRARLGLSGKNPEERAAELKSLRDEWDD